jgi:probable F420-dependent oxidoreductase
MKIGLAALGIGVGAQPEVVIETAKAAERAGFARLWVGEHVVLFDAHRSHYPYTESGKFPFEAAVDWLDPFATLSFAAAVTTRIGLATGICLLPEHNPLIVAKTAATIDHLSNGRFAMGIGIGWMAEEFAALGVPFERRAERTREYVAAMRALWSGESASFHGEFVKFDSVKAFPKPAPGSRLPIIIGGESVAALRRVAEYGGLVRTQSESGRSSEPGRDAERSAGTARPGCDGRKDRRALQQTIRARRPRAVSGGGYR